MAELTCPDCHRVHAGVESVPAAQSPEVARCALCRTVRDLQTIESVLRELDLFIASQHN